MAIELKGNGTSTFSNNITSSTGDLTLGDGNLVVANTHGIDFNAGANANASSNLFDEYEEGTFTPELIWRDGSNGSTSSAGPSPGSKNYFKIGRMIFASFNIGNVTTTPNVSNNANAGLAIRNLPPYASAGNFVPCGSVSFGGVVAGRPIIQSFQFSGSTTIVGLGCVTTDGNDIRGTALFNNLTANGGTSLIVNLMYEVAA